MKKVIILITCFALIITCFKSNAQSKTTKISLNGINEKSAKQMMAQYAKYKGQDQTPTKVNVWISDSVFHKMVQLLIKENSMATSSKDSTDGMRIYFASDTTVNSGSLQNSVIFVSTKYGGVNPDKTMPSGAFHNDYYTHDANDPLFADPAALKVKIYKKGLFRTGGLLYKTCTNCKPFICLGNDIHYTERSKAEELVQNFGTDTMRTIGEWFDLNLLKALDSDTTHDGIRIYFIKHGPNETWPDPSASNKEGFLLVPTVKHYTLLLIKTHRDNFDCQVSNYYIPRFKNSANGTLYMKSFESMHPELKAMASPLSPGGSPGGQDNGELCPANCTTP